jgi:hypothetical protein
MAEETSIIVIAEKVIGMADSGEAEKVLQDSISLLVNCIYAKLFLR